MEEDKDVFDEHSIIRDMVNVCPFPVATTYIEAREELLFFVWYFWIDGELRKFYLAVSSKQLKETIDKKIVINSILDKVGLFLLKYKVEGKGECDE